MFILHSRLPPTVLLCCLHHCLCLYPPHLIQQERSMGTFIMLKELGCTIHGTKITCLLSLLGTLGQSCASCSVEVWWVICLRAHQQTSFCFFFSLEKFPSSFYFSFILFLFIFSLSACQYALAEHQKQWFQGKLFHLWKSDWRWFLKCFIHSAIATPSFFSVIFIPLILMNSLYDQNL